MSNTAILNIDFLTHKKTIEVSLDLSVEEIIDLVHETLNEPKFFTAMRYEGIQEMGYHYQIEHSKSYNFIKSGTLKEAGVEVGDAVRFSQEILFD